MRRLTNCLCVLGSLVMSTGLAISGTAAADAQRDPDDIAPIMVLMDLHADPMADSIPVQQQQYIDWVLAADWLLDLTDSHGAKISFLSTGEFMEWALGDTMGGHPLILRLYGSGGQLGTHSHDRIRVGVHQWQPLPPDPTPAQVIQHWDDHVGAVNMIITNVLGVTDPNAICAINCCRGTHVPSDDPWRLQLMADYGFTMHQQGPDEEFYSYFKHYPMNPFRPSGAGPLVHDPDGPVVLSPFGPVLGKNEVHFGILQDMRVPAIQARFMLELLNWLHDAHVANTQRPWVTGWASHAHDIVPGTPTRISYPIILDWLDAHFIGKPVGGHPAAAYASMRDSRDAFLAWEAAHPGQAAFSYPDDQTNWCLYPYLRPAATYVADAWYEEPMPPAQTVRWHRLTASDAIGGPFDMYVAFVVDASPATVDLSASIGVGEIAAVDPATGDAQLMPGNAVHVPVTGTILVPPTQVIEFFAPGDVNEDGTVDVSDLLLVLAAWGPCPGCPEDVNCDDEVNVSDLLIVLAAWG